MGLRHAQVVAAIGRVGARSYQTRLDSVELVLSRPNGKPVTLTIGIAAGIGIITGGNGAGKTTLLRGLRALDGPQDPEWPHRLLAMQASGAHAGAGWIVRFERSGNSEIEQVATSGDLPHLEVIDPADESQAIRAQFASDPNADDLLAGTDPAPFDDELLAHASRILRRAYDFVRVFEVEGADGDSVVPWFEIGASGTSYNALSAGRGELSGLYMLWRLSRVPDNSIVVIDEPEAWLASFSQARLKESLAYMSVNRSIQFVLTSHSPDIFLGLPGAPVTILEALPEPFTRGPIEAQAAAHALGAPMRPAIALLLEDAVALALVEALMRHADSILLEAVEFYHAENGESALVQVQKEFLDRDSRRRKLRLAVVLDGDQRRMHNGVRRKDDNRLYLPGNAAPEAVMRQATDVALASCTDVDLAGIGVSNPLQFRQAVLRAAGSDHHDWFVEVASEFASYSAACDVLARLCLRDGAFSKDVDALLAGIKELM